MFWWRSVSLVADDEGAGGCFTVSRSEILSVADLTALPRFRAILLASGTPATMIETIPWMSGPHAQKVKDSLAAPKQREPVTIPAHNPWTHGDLREAAGTRPDISKPIWQVSLRTAPGDRRLSVQQWQDAATIMAERMGYEEHPWVMVRHGEDHVRIVVSRVGDTAQVWHARQDFRAAQSAATALEKHFDLIQAPRQKAPGRARSSQKTIIEKQQQTAAQLTKQRAAARVQSVVVRSLMDSSFPTPQQRGNGLKNGPAVKRQVTERRPDRGFER